MHDVFVERMESGTLNVGIIGLGYIGLPLSLAFASGGFHVTGFDIDANKVEALNAGEFEAVTFREGI